MNSNINPKNDFDNRVYDHKSLLSFTPNIDTDMKRKIEEKEIDNMLNQEMNNFLSPGKMSQIQNWDDTKAISASIKKSKPKAERTKVLDKTKDFKEKINNNPINQSYNYLNVLPSVPDETKSMKDIKLENNKDDNRDDNKNKNKNEEKKKRKTPKPVSELTKNSKFILDLT